MKLIIWLKVNMKHSSDRPPCTALTASRMASSDHFWRAPWRGVVLGIYLKRTGKELCFIV